MPFRRGADGAKVLKSGSSVTGREVSRVDSREQGVHAGARGVCATGEAQGVTKALRIY
jgi:hypothetical protein